MVVSRSLPWSFGLVLFVSIAPFALELAGVDLGTQGPPFDPAAAIGQSPAAVVDAMHYSLSGSFTHTLLEWSAFCTAAFTVVLSFVYFRINRDPVTPVLGLALFYAGCMDAFHTLAADRLIEGAADHENLVPFTWAICRLFVALILLVGTGGLLLGPKRQPGRGSWPLLAGASLLAGAIAYVTILACVRSPTLPQTQFPDAIVTRPWDVAPLVLFAIGGLTVFPAFFWRYPNPFSLALLASTVPQVATQLHMALGSSALFDSNFNAAHFLKIVAYLVPFGGLCWAYVQLNQDKNLALRAVEAAHQTLARQAKSLTEANARLEREARDRDRARSALQRKTLDLERTLADLQRTQAQLVQTEKMSGLGQLVAGVAHEINNPVNFIHGNLAHARNYAADLLAAIALYRDRYPEAEADPDFAADLADLDADFAAEDFPKVLASMQAGTDRIKAIVASLRSFSRLDEAAMKQVDLHEGLESALTILHHRLKTACGTTDDGRRLEITVVRDYGDLPLVDCYASQVNQALMNLLLNAIDALEEAARRLHKFQESGATLGPTLTIATGCPRGEDLGETRRDRVRIAITDNGTGMDDRARARLFDPFFTTKPVGRGTGMGLAIAYQVVVTAHGGTLDCQSVPRQGTTFVMELPTTPPLRPDSPAGDRDGRLSAAPSGFPPPDGRLQ